MVQTMGLGTHSVFNLTLLLLLSSISGTTSNTFHIVTSLNAPCPGEFIGDPCLTLQQYVSNPSISTDNVTLLFESGNHTITSTLSSSNANNFTMSGNNVEIQCSSSAIQITLTSVQHVHISGLSFTGCGSSTLGTNGRSVYLENASFLRSGGITVQNISQGVNITDMVFSVNNYHITVSINDVSNGSVHLNNVVTDAGMIVGAVNRSIHFYNVEKRILSAIYYYTSTVTLQNANSISLQNVVLSQRSTLTISSVRQMVQWSNVSISQSSSITISSAGQMVQWSNVSISRGNAITISSAGQLNMEDCTLQYIQSTSPALILSHISMVTIARCGFSSNVSVSYTHLTLPTIYSV